jgi:hypothetical protein
VLILRSQNRLLHNVRKNTRTRSADRLSKTVCVCVTLTEKKTARSVPRSVMQGVGACRDEPLLRAVPRVDLRAVAASCLRWWNSLPVPSAAMVVVVVVMVVVVFGWRCGVEAAGHGEQHLPRKNSDDRTCRRPPHQQASAAEASAAPVERNGEHGQPQEEDDGGGVSRSSHCHPAGCWPTSELMDQTKLLEHQQPLWEQIARGRRDALLRGYSVPYVCCSVRA